MFIPKNPLKITPETLHNSIFDGFFFGGGGGWFGVFLIFIIGKQGLINRSIQIISRYIKNKNHISVESFSLSLVYGHE